MVFRSPWPNFLGFLYTTSKFRFLGDVKSFLLYFYQKITKYCSCISLWYKIKNGSIEVTSGFYLDLEDELTISTFQKSPISPKLRFCENKIILFLIIYMSSYRMNIVWHTGLKTPRYEVRTFLVKLCVFLSYSGRYSALDMHGWVCNPSWLRNQLVKPPQPSRWLLTPIMVYNTKLLTWNNSINSLICNIYHLFL